MSESRIEIDFSVAYAQAKKLEDIANEMRQVATKQFGNTISKISSAWTGEAASEYIQKAEIVKNNILKTAQSIDNVASGIRRNALKIYKAEKAAAEIAKTRNT